MMKKVSDFAYNSRKKRIFGTLIKIS